ncbi:Na(+)/H(+) antiporter subunit D [Hyphomonas jannaschiana]|uniref:Monovalent cation/H+ antiporter subunit D n=1 Tax=Hyphomonas jannaschiana VP2 TaxID=1280952 RepID=A0A059F7N2_9PROT|nr:Na(+)/H(+) antiporter subunit D [Hyphomonas jannaschiana]KCZ86553.1 monovalent cation/H+ antiporter subunit D [Hyphomonas jannaschiana VP2]
MPTMLAGLNPGWVLILAGIASLFITLRSARQVVTIAAPLLALLLLIFAPQNTDLVTTQVLGLKMVLYRVDALNFIFSLAFLIAAVLNGIYALHSNDRIQDGAALFYAGAAVAATLAGDLMTLFVFWELTAISSVFLILRAQTREAYFAAMRYLGVQVLSGVLLLNGLAYVLKSRGNLSLEAFTDLSDPGVLFIFIAFGIKAAFPLLHNWLQDAYPKATVVGSVVLSVYTTKLAVYALARMFPGQDHLIWIGATMTVFPVFFAVIENDLRRVLSYSINNQVGFMVCGVGVGTPLAINGVAAHAFADIFFKGLLMMSMGAVLYRTGTVKASQLGGLHRSMPWTTVFCIIGAMSISAFPLFSAFVTKSMIISEVATAGYAVIFLMLMFASAGVLEHSGIKIPYYAFFGHDSGLRVKEAPFNMLLAMGIAAGLCIFLGLPALFPGFGHEWLYGLLPYREEAMGYSHHHLFSFEHILTQFQLLVLAIFAFVLLKRIHAYPPEKRGVILDTDWIYRKVGYNLVTWAGTVWGKAGPAMTAAFFRVTGRAYNWIEAAFSPRGELARGGALNGAMAIWTAALLGVVLLLSFMAVG